MHSINLYQIHTTIPLSTSGQQSQLPGLLHKHGVRITEIIEHCTIKNVTCYQGCYCCNCCCYYYYFDWYWFQFFVF